MILFFDFEVTTWNKGNPFDSRNFAVCIGYETDQGAKGVVYLGEDGSEFRHLLGKADLLVGFNLKFDLHWLRKVGLSFEGKRVFDCQVAEFTLNGQHPKYPSLEDCCIKYGLGTKIDVIKRDYWDKGINTHEIPRAVLSGYCAQDVSLTRKLYERLRLRPDYNEKKILLSLVMQDLLVLEEIEWNGLYFNPEVVKEKELELDKQIASLQESLNIYHSIPCFNWASPAHLSALLFGGTIKEDIKVPDGTFKSGKRVGQPKFRNATQEHILPRMYTPPKGSETKKAGVFSVDEDTLLKIKGGKKELIEKILKVKELSKLQSTYIRGLLDLHREKFWPPNYLHGQYNQCVASTGRLSSSEPNMQNMSGDILDMFQTRFQ